jgi:DNA invertase Pin-like site-specific DNA recombinase
VGYLRITVGLGVQRQREDIERKAEADGVTLIRFYTDNDIGASTRSTKARPDFAAMLKDARSGAAGSYVYAYSNSRLTRRPREFEDLLDLHDATRIQFRTVVSGDDDLSTADGRMVARLKAVVDAAEAERLSERITRKLQANAAAGKHHGGSRPFGWNEDRRTLRQLEADEIVQALDKALLGASVRGLARDLTERAIPPAAWHPPLVLKKWSDVQVRSILMNPRIAGLRTYKGEIVGPGAWEAVVPEDRWRELQALWANPERVSTPGRNGSDHWLSGVVRCGECNALMRVGKGKPYKTTPGKPIYRCQAENGSHVMRDKASVDTYVRAVILARLRRADVADLLRPQDTTAEIEAAADRLRELEERQADAAKGYAAGQITIAQLVAINDALTPQIEKAQAASVVGVQPADELKELTKASDPEPVWDGLSPLQQRAIAAVLLEVRILPTRRGPGFDPSSVAIEWRRM